MNISRRHKQIENSGEVSAAMRRQDISMLLGAMKLFAWLNLVQGALNIIFYTLLPVAHIMLLGTGIMSVIMWALVYLKIHYMMHTKNWIQISVTAVCGLYLPILMLVVSSMEMGSSLLK